MAPSKALICLPSMVSVFAAIISVRLAFGVRRLPLRTGPSAGLSNSRYSLRKKRRVLSTGFGAVWPRPQRLVFRTMSHSSSSFCKSAAVAWRAEDLAQQMVHLHGAGPAGDAFAARFVHAEFHEKPGHIHHPGGLVHDDHAARTHDGTELGRAIRNRPACPAPRPGCSRPKGRRSGRP